MNRSDFQKVVEEFQARESRLLDLKRAEYASEEGDVLRNFKTLSQMLGIDPSQVTATYLAKHVQAVLKQVVDERSFSWSWQRADGSEGLKQRISDARNYLLLLAACIDEEAQEALGPDRDEEIQAKIEAFLSSGKKKEITDEEIERLR